MVPVRKKLFQNKHRLIISLNWDHDHLNQNHYSKPHTCIYKHSTGRIQHYLALIIDSSFGFKHLLLLRKKHALSKLNRKSGSFAAFQTQANADYISSNGRTTGLHAMPDERLTHTSLSGGGIICHTDALGL